MKQGVCLDNFFNLCHFSSYENAMDLHGMHASTSYAQMPATFGTQAQGRSKNKLHIDVTSEDKSKASERSERSVTHGGLLTAGSPLQVLQPLSNASSRSSIPSAGLSSASSRRSFSSLQSNESIDETEKESTPEYLGAKPKFTITTPEKKSSKAFNFDDIVALSDQSPISESTNELDEYKILLKLEDDVVEDEIVEIKEIRLLEQCESELTKENVNEIEVTNATSQTDKPPKLGLKRSKFKLSLPKLTELPSLMKKEICRKCAKWHDLGKSKMCTVGQEDDEQNHRVNSRDSKHAIVHKQGKVGCGDEVKHTRNNGVNVNQNTFKTDAAKGCDKGGEIKKLSGKTANQPTIVKAEIHTLVDELFIEEDSDTDIEKKENSAVQERACGLIISEVKDKNDVDNDVVKCPFESCFNDNQSPTKLHNTDPYDANKTEKKVSEGLTEGLTEDLKNTDWLSQCPFYAGLRLDLCNGTESELPNNNSSIQLRTRISEGNITLNQNGGRDSLGHKTNSMPLRNGTVSHDELKSLPQETISSFGNLYEIHDANCTKGKGALKSVPANGDLTKSEGIVIFQISDQEDKGSS